MRRMPGTGKASLRSPRARGARVFAAVAALLLFPLSLLAATDAQSVYDDLFGQEAKQIAESAIKTDDVAFASRLLKAADELQGQADLKALLYEKACEYAMHSPTGYAVALQALDGLDKTVPAKRAENLQTRLLLAQALYNDAKTPDERLKTGRTLLAVVETLANRKMNAGQFADAVPLYRQAASLAEALRLDSKDDLQAKLKQAQARVAIDLQLEQVKAKLKASPDDKTALEQLVHIYLVDLDNPVEAVKYQEGLADETLQKFLLVAAMKVQSIPEKACLALGDWYRDLASAASVSAKPAMFRRAKAYYAQYLALHTDEDADRTRATLGLEQMNRSLEGVEFSGWVDLLKLVDPAKDAYSGRWRLQSAALYTSGSSTELLRLPYQPPEEYDVQIVFSRQLGRADVGVLLYKAGAQFEWVMDVGGSRCGFEAIDGERVVSLKNPTGFTAQMKNGQKYTLVLQVRNTGVKALIDGHQAADFKTDYKNLAATEGFTIPGTKCLGLLSWNSSTVFYSIRVQEVTGKGKIGHETPPPKDRKLISP
jgi:hypothetical protein